VLLVFPSQRYGTPMALVLGRSIRDGATWDGATCDGSTLNVITKTCLCHWRGFGASTSHLTGGDVSPWKLELTHKFRKRANQQKGLGSSCKFVFASQGKCPSFVSKTPTIILFLLEMATIQSIWRIYCFKTAFRSFCC
jgi:hypothetical protein